MWTACTAQRTNPLLEIAKVPWSSNIPVYMEHHEGLADALKLEVHDGREGSAH